MNTDQPLRLAEIADAAALMRLVNDPARSALILFDAGRHGPGRRLEERLLRLSGEEPVNVARVDADRMADVAQRFGVKGIPALVLFRFGQVVASRLGEIEDQDLQDWIEAELVA